jgi:hypothetical protein
MYSQSIDYLSPLLARHDITDVAKKRPASTVVKAGLPPLRFFFQDCYRILGLGGLPSVARPFPCLKNAIRAKTAWVGTVGQCRCPMAQGARPTAAAPSSYSPTLHLHSMPSFAALGITVDAKTLKGAAEAETQAPRAHGSSIDRACGIRPPAPHFQKIVKGRVLCFLRQRA